MAGEIKWFKILFICSFLLFPLKGFSGDPVNADSLLADTTEIFPGPAQPETSTSGEFYGNPHLLPASNDIKPIEAAEKKDWLFWIITLSFFLIALSRYYFRSRMQQFFRAAFANRHFKLMEKEGNFFNETVTYLLFLNFVIVISLLLYQTLSFLQVRPLFGEVHPIMVYGFIFLLFLGFYPLKALVTGFLAWVFKTHNANSAYLKNIFLFNQLTGLILLPIVAYSIYNPSATGITMAWIIAGIANLIKVIRGTAMGYNEARFSGYYLILYLCAVEIAPLLVIIKAGINYFTIPASTGF